MKREERLYWLMARKLAGMITAGEGAELEVLRRQYPEADCLLTLMIPGDGAVDPGSPDTEAAYERLRRRLVSLGAGFPGQEGGGLPPDGKR